MGTADIVELVVLVVLLLLSAFFSSAETAISSVNRVKVRALEEAGKKHAKTLNHIYDNYDRALTTILIGNNIVNLSASSIATLLTARLWGNVYVSVSTGVLTFLVLIFGEIVPKTWARRNADKLSLSFAPVIKGIMIVLFPIVFIIQNVARFFLFIFRQNKEADEAITEDELRTYVDVSHEDGVIESDEKKIINNVFDFSDAIARDVMIPRIDMISIPEDSTYKDIMKVFRETMYTRLPVYKGDAGNINGFINVKDLLRLKNPAAFEVSKFRREAFYTYEYKKTSDLLIEMRDSAMTLAFVLNEYGETVGMITLEDLLEEIVGQIRDEYDEDEEGLIKETDEGYLIEARMKLEDINDELGTKFESEDYDSIGGLVLDQLDRIPEDGETVTLEDGTVLKVEGIRMNRIVKVLVTLPHKENESEAEE
ncbi:Hemolysin, contains CBS domains [Lachnospiraceae bacterium YSD2013]|nr:Hemolysin, contains CBS domains [Lachnospiraceae bacterium YSD2013]